MKTPFTLESMLRAAGERMKQDLAHRLIAHPGELGSDREEIVRQFLRAYLPKRFEISTGFVFDCHGRISGQIDIVIFNSLSCPRFETPGGVRFFPCESVVAVGQVKSSLRRQRDLDEAIQNLESVKSLDRSAGGRAIDVESGERLNNLDNHRDQIFGFILVAGKALAPDSLHERFLHYTVGSQPHLWPNVILVLGSCLITFCCDDGVCPNPMHARGVALQLAGSEDLLLDRFYVLLGRALQSTRISSLPYWEYLQRARKWDAKVFYAATGDEGEPPPYLSSVPRPAPTACGFCSKRDPIWFCTQCRLLVCGNCAGGGFSTPTCPKGHGDLTEFSG